MSAVLDFPPLPVIDEPREVATEVVDAAPAAALVPLRDHAMQPLSAVERGIADLRAEHGSTAYDIKTPAGYRLATLRRASVRAVRYAVPKIVKEKKAELAGLREQVEEEGARIVELLREIEDPHDALIEAENERRAEIKAEAIRVDAARVEAHRTNIDLIRSYLQHAQQPGMSAARVAAGIDTLAQRTFPVETWEEFAGPALAAQEETLQAMRKVWDEIVERDAREEAARVEAARVEAQRIENERAEARLAELKKKIDDENAALAARTAAFEAEQAAIKAQREAEDARLARIAVAQQLDPIRPDDPEAEPPMTVEQMGGETVDRDHALTAMETGGQILSSTNDPAEIERALSDEAPAATAPAAPDAETTLTSICGRLGWTMGADFISMALNVEPTRRAGRAIFYSQANVAAIKAALINHIQGSI